MMKHIPAPARNRYLAITIGTGVIALLTAIYVIGAPPIPAIAGVVLTVAWLIWRAPAA